MSASRLLDNIRRLATGNGDENGKDVQVEVLKQLEVIDYSPRSWEILIDRYGTLP
jgi:hypothetical protein